MLSAACGRRGVCVQCVCTVCVWCVYVRTVHSA